MAKPRGDESTNHATIPPSPPGIPIIGHGPKFARDPVGAFDEWAAVGDVIRLRIIGQSLYLVTHPDLIERILVEEQHRFTISPNQRQAFEGVEDHAMSTASGEDWSRYRRAAHPAFTKDTIDGYRDRMASVTASFVDRWSDGDRTDLLRAMRRLTVQILGETLIGEDLRGREDVVIEAADAVVARSRFDRPGQLLPDWVPTPTDRRFRRTVNRLNAYIGELVEDRSRGNDGADRDVCSVLLDAHERDELSREEVRGNLAAFMLAGHESPSGTLTRTWYLLNRHPAVRDTLREEYDAVVAGDRPGAEDYDALERHRHVIDETLRVYPPTAGVARMATEDIDLGRYRLPAESTVIMPQWIPHRDERWWDGPETFRPDRWTDPDPDRPDYAYFPFGGGPRTCIGNHFARQELTIALATMVGRVDLDIESDQPLEFLPAIQLRPRNDLTAEIRKLDR